MRLAIVVQRYGREILGGSETLARQLAERLARRHEITVLTTTARDYITWKNEYEPGEQKLRGVRLLRFPVAGERNLEEFNKFSEEIYQGNATREQEVEWLHQQGPVAPELIEHLKKEHARYDLLVFFTYLYYPTYFGLQVAPEKSVLVPTAHDEPPLRLTIFREMFQLPSSFLFNTEAEELLMLERFPIHKKMRETIGMGMELLDQPDTSAFRRKHNVPGMYLLYAGRIDAGKGLEELFRYFTFYKEENPASGNLQLILIGKLGMKLPADSSIRYIGFVDEGDKLSAMAGAEAVIQPSRMESLSIVALEAFSVGTPVIANGASRVLVDHCRRANAGFYYNDFEEFEALLDLLFSDRTLGRAMGRNGQRYVKEHYGWHKLLPKYELAFRASARPSKEPRAARWEPQAVARQKTEALAEAAETVEENVTGSAEPQEAEVEVVEKTPSEQAGQEATDKEAPTVVTEEEVEDDSPLPSFYRASIPPRAVDEKPEPQESAPPATPADPEEPETEETPAESVEESQPEMQPGELPDFYKPRSRGSAAEGENSTDG